MVKGDIIEEMLIAVHQLQNNMKVVMNKVENIENTLEVDMNSLKQNIKVLHEEVETNSNQDKILIKSFDSFKVEEKSLKQNENSSEEINRIKQNGKDCIESCLKPSDVYLEKMESLQVEVKSVQNSLK